jgi:peroxiredoxin
MMFKHQWPNILPTTLVGVLAIYVIILTKKNHALEDDLHFLKTPPEPLTSGDTVPPFTMIDLDGNEHLLTYQDHPEPYLFYIFSTSCPFCEKNIDAWSTLMEFGRQHGVDVVGLSMHDMEKTREYFTSRMVPYQVFSVNDTSFAKRYKIFAVPQTLLINGDGRVERCWFGKLSREQVDEIRSVIASTYKTQ